MKIIFVKINSMGKFSKHLFFFNFREETYSISFVRITFHEFHKKDILPVGIFFCMRLNASVCKANQRPIKKTELSIQSFLSSFF